MQNCTIFCQEMCFCKVFFGGIRGFLILTRDLYEIIMPAKENDIIFYFSFPGGPVVEFAKASASCVGRRDVLIGSKPDPRYALREMPCVPHGTHQWECQCVLPDVYYSIYQ
jgi:hypothetical protein